MFPSPRQFHKHYHIPGGDNPWLMEMSALDSSCTWKLVPLPFGKSVFGCKWWLILIFPSGKEIYTSLWSGFNDIFPSAKTDPLFLAMAAFLHCHLEDKIYMEQPPVFVLGRFFAEVFVQLKTITSGMVWSIQQHCSTVSDDLLALSLFFLSYRYNHFVWLQEINVEASQHWNNTYFTLQNGLRSSVFSWDRGCSIKVGCCCLLIFYKRWVLQIVNQLQIYTLLTVRRY